MIVTQTSASAKANTGKMLTVVIQHNQHKYNTHTTANNTNTM